MMKALGKKKDGHFLLFHYLVFGLTGQISATSKSLPKKKSFYLHNQSLFERPAIRLAIPRVKQPTVRRLWIRGTAK